MNLSSDRTEFIDLFADRTEFIEYMNLFKKDLVGPYNSSSYKSYT